MLDALLSDAEVVLRQVRRTSFMGLLAAEDNPLTSDKAAMFDMFDRGAVVRRSLPAIHHQPAT